MYVTTSINIVLIGVSLDFESFFLVDDFLYLFLILIMDLFFDFQMLDEIHDATKDSVVSHKIQYNGKDKSRIGNDEPNCMG